MPRKALNAEASAVSRKETGFKLDQALTAANIKYLVTLAGMQTDAGVRCTDIAKKLGVSRPSVHSMIDTLSERGLVSKQRYGAVYLTEAGCLIASRCAECYELLFAKLKRSLGLSDIDCRDAACSLLSRSGFPLCF